MRFTVTLDDDVSTLIKQEMRRTGKSFKAVVNESLVEGLQVAQERAPKEGLRADAIDIDDLTWSGR